MDSPKFTAPAILTDTARSNRLVPVDFLQMLCFSSNSRYIFCRSTIIGNRFVRRIDTSGVITTGADASTLQGQNIGNSTIESIFAYEDAVFMQVFYFTGLFRFLFKSVDDGVTFGNNAPLYNNGQYVARVGEISGTHYGDISILGTRGFCKATVNGQTKYLYGEYNVSAITIGAAVSAGTHVRIMGSSNGDSWSSVYSMNTVGTNKVSHAHMVRQDTYSGYIYFGYGDGSGAGIVRWDGSATGADNIAPASVASVSGFLGVGGSVDYQTTDLIFTENWIFNPVDTSVGGSQGMRRFKRDFSSYEKFYTGNAANVGHALYWGLKHSSGVLIATELLEAAATKKTLLVYASLDDGSTWQIVGELNLQASGFGSPDGFFEGPDGRIYMSLGFNGAGKFVTTVTDVTAVLKLQGQFTSDEPEILHPVYWVDKGGSNANDGYRPSTPWLTAAYALTGNRITNGARVIFGPGEWSEATIIPVYDANTYPALSSNKTVIEGAGIGKTKLINPTAATYFMFQEPEEMPQRFTNLDIYADNAAATGTVFSQATTVTETTDFLKCSIGKANNLASGALNQSYGSTKLDRCFINDAISHVATSLNLTLYSCVQSTTRASAITFSSTAGALAGYNNVLNGYATNGVLISAGVTVQPTWKNSIHSGAGVAVPINNASALSLSSTTINYNLFDRAGTALGTSGANNIATGTDPVYTNKSYGLFSVSPSSTCINGGSTTLATRNMIDELIDSTPNVGAY